MGRVLQGTIDEIKALHSKGFTNKEITEKTGISPGTIKKYLEDGSGKGNVAESQIIFECFFELLQDLSTSSFLEREQLADLVDRRALEVAKKLFRVNKDLAKKVLEAQVQHLKSINVLNLSVPDQNLPDSDHRLREEWVSLLKENYPEKMADLV